ncbi:MAG: lysophospholipid acyltransferase family protein, partial [Synechococcaceae cyanobacterium]
GDGGAAARRSTGDAAAADAARGEGRGPAWGNPAAAERARGELARFRRDPRLIRALMPLWGWAHRHYFHVTSAGWNQVPLQGPVLFIGSHNGGLAAPDMHMAIYEWYQRQGLERPIRGLAHPKWWRVDPRLAQLARGPGAIPAHPRLARAALEERSSLLIYPGGAEEACRPHRQRDRVDLQGRTGFLRLALEFNLPILPLVSWGSHDTLFILEDLYPLARALQRRGVLRWPLGIDPEVLPLYLGLPWGLMLGPIPNLPLPTPIRLSIGAPIQLDRRGVAASRDRRYLRECYQLVETTMQRQLDQVRGPSGG